MISTQRRCRHCQRLYGCRIGRGLCRTCYFDPPTKAKYAPLAPFGGRWLVTNIVNPAAMGRPARFDLGAWLAADPKRRPCADCREVPPAAGSDICRKCTEALGERLRAEIAEEELATSAGRDLQEQGHHASRLA